MVKGSKPLVRTLLRWSLTGLSWVPMAVAPAIAAERVALSYSIFGRSVSIESLELFAKEGKLTPELLSYSRYIKPEQRAALRQGLQRRIQFSSVALAQYLYSPTGEILVRRLSEVLRTRSNQGSFNALRSALIIAANDPEGLSVLTVLRHYPNTELVIDLDQAFAIVREVEELFNQTVAVTRRLEERGAATDLTELPDLSALYQLGSRTWQKTTLKLEDQSPKRLTYTQKRRFPVDLYIPDGAQGVPVVVISHGLNSDRSSYSYLAEHLASHGFAVVVPEHPGSNRERLQALFAGKGSDVARPSEFLDRPLDVQYVLDTLQRDRELQGRLQLDNVGIIGQSFGGYTSLASSGASLNFQHLSQVCREQLTSTLNSSIVLQCQALRLNRQPYQLQEPRIKAAIAINPIMSALFSPTELASLDLPMMVVTGSADVVAPALPEQIRPFTLLQAPNRKLALIKNSTHFSTILPSEDIPLPQALDAIITGPSPEVARKYLKVLSLAFLEMHLMQNSANAIALQPQGAAALSRPTLPLTILDSLSPTILEEPES